MVNARERREQRGKYTCGSVWYVDVKIGGEERYGLEKVKWREGDGKEKGNETNEGGCEEG